MASRKLEFDGLGLHVYRSKTDNKIVIDISTEGLEPEDCHAGDVPNIRFYINECKVEIDSDGALVEEEGTNMLTLACACGGVGEYVIVSAVIALLASLGIIKTKTKTKKEVIHNDH